MLSGLLALLGVIPGIGSVITYVTGKVFDSRVAIETARIGGNRDIIVARLQAAASMNATMVAGVTHSRIFAFIILGFAVPWMAYEWKVVVWDTLFEYGSTGPIHGAVADWGQTIIYSLFGSGTVLALGHMAFNKGDVK